MKNLSLFNQHLSARISPLGAELKSLKFKDTEYLWRGDPAFWPKTSPVLFPIIGALKEDTYYFQGKSYRLSRHGFARDREFKAEQISESEAVFTLQDDATSRVLYPFKFVFRIRYRLNGNTLSCRYEIENPAEETLWFSVGGHPAFATSKGSYLRFEADEELYPYPLEGNLLLSTPEQLPLEDKTLILTPELFYNDALVLKDLKSRKITLVNPGASLEFSFGDFPYFGIWAARNADFVCLEPWCGIADNVNHSQQLMEKEGIISLAGSERWKREWSITVT